MNYKIIDAVLPDGTDYQYLLVDNTWCVPMTEENPMYQAYLNKDKPQVEHLTEIIPADEAKIK